MEPKRLRRSESFLGIHFDFHAGMDCTEIGKGVSPEMVQRIISMVKPDYIQCDCKGHGGISSYPTKVGHPAPGFVRDSLAIWREVTARNGVALYMHYSGVWDSEFVHRHPQWAAAKADGKPNDRITSLYGPYVEQLLIPQLKELADAYGVDGAWVDGDCWAVEQDYCQKAVEAFRSSAGLQDVPRRPEEPGWPEFTELARQAFRKYLARYVDAIHAHAPQFQIASNWAFSSMMPEPVTIPVDFISGDYTPQDSVNSARFEGRCMLRQGKPWDLMAWSFSGRGAEATWTTKAPVQLMQEAAVVLALGGGFQAYFQQKRDASVALWQMELMARTAEFCRARQAACHKAEPVPQIALLYAAPSMYRSNPAAFRISEHPCVQAMKGIMQMLLDSQNVVEICVEHHLDGRMDEYPLVVVPEWDWLEETLRKKLVEYARRGGSLLVVGSRAAAMFQEELDVTLEGDQDGQTRRWLEHGGWMGILLTRFQRVKLGPRARALGAHYGENDPQSPSSAPAGVVSSLGKGKIAAILLDMGRQYLQAATPVSRSFLKRIVDELFPEPIVKVTGSHSVDVTLMRKDGKLQVNLVNTGGPHGDPDVFVYDEIPPVGPLSIEVRTDARPRSVSCQPGAKGIPWEYADGKVRVAIERLEIHDIITLG